MAVLVECDVETRYCAHAGSPCPSLLRLAAWIVGLKGAAEPEPALLAGLREEQPGYANSKVSNFECIIGPEKVAIEACKLVEALARRRVANCVHLPSDVLQRLFSFRERTPVRWAALAAVARRACMHTFDFLLAAHTSLEWSWRTPKRSRGRQWQRRRS